MTTLSLGQPYRRGAAPKAGIEAVRETDTDALTSRLAACRAGYLPPDSYAEMQASPQSREAHRPPLISIGTYLRAREMDRHMEHFLATGSLRQETASSTTPVQVINIGAGSDTRFWRMSMATSNVALYVELDFPETTRQKAACIEQHEAMQMPLGSWTRTDDGLEADKYWLVGADLSTLRTSETWDRLRSRLDPSYPTLIVCECVLAYLDAEQANTLLQGWLEQLSHVAILSYDICLGGDAPDTQEPTRFGHVMLQNLAVRRLTLPGARHPICI
ncbi:leucine carboxyl methyltransferase [Malassezia pachydermatis]|uniref:Leucine carboxyl methyltransferase 1 n=1 Tax=Malassezia pachydermatis TaxID=77020 RepID=A0A0M8MVP6_9BASI|nr:leucine carboxyl methyltransferase [Malassezia pachydermatis]KOS14720.1 leucine carboxyl methyltransferase [Malassezia pachydermatis]